MLRHRPNSPWGPGCGWRPRVTPSPKGGSRACGGQRLPSKDYARNGAWLQLAALAVSLNAWLRLIPLDGDLAKAEPKMLRSRIFSAPARLETHACKEYLQDPTRLGLGR